MPAKYRLIYSPRLASDLHSIFRYIERDSPQNATRMIQKIIEGIDSLEQLPHRYPVAEGANNRRGEIRVMTIRPYLVFYRILEEQQAIRLITVRHGARQRPDNLE